MNNNLHGKCSKCKNCGSCEFIKLFPIDIYKLSRSCPLYTVK